MDTLALTTQPQAGSRPETGFQPCDSCHREDALLVQLRGIGEGGAIYEREEHLCPACAAHARLYDAAGINLFAHLRGSLGPWLEHWKEQGLTDAQAAEILRLVAGDVAGHWHAE